MVHVLLRIAIWVLVLGIGYLAFGPALFESSRNANPFQSNRALFLPPAKAQRQIEYESIMRQRNLEGEELAEYQALVQERQSKFWSSKGVSVEEALSGVKKQRKEHLVAKLVKRGLSNGELAIFLTVVERDHAALLADRE